MRLRLAWQVNNLAHLLIRMRLRRLGLWLGREAVPWVAGPVDSDPTPAR